MTELNSPFGSADNERALEDIVWPIEMSQEQFSLILALCNSNKLRDSMVKQLRETCPNIEEIVLKPSDTLIYSKVKELSIQKQPEAVMIRGLELVTDINQMLTVLNQLREEFWKSFKFPIILWINEAILTKMIRYTPDIESWASITYFNSFTKKHDVPSKEKLDSVNKHSGLGIQNFWIANILSKTQVGFLYQF